MVLSREHERAPLKTVGDYFHYFGIESSSLRPEVAKIVIEFPVDGFQAHKGSYILAKELAAVVRPGDKVLEIGTGSGLLAITAATLGAEVIATDIDANSLAVAQNNATKNAVAIQFVQASLLEPLKKAPHFDIIVFNLPSAPTAPSAQSHDHLHQGGEDGRFFIDRLLDDLPALLRPNAKVLTVQTHLSQYAKTLQRLQAMGGKVSTKSPSIEPLGSASLSQLEYMKESLPPEAQPFKVEENGPYYYKLAVVLAEFKSRHSL